MARKLVMTLGVLIIALVVLLLILTFATKQEPSGYSDNPKDWFAQEPNGTVTLDFEKATENRGEYNLNNQQMRIGTQFVPFEYSGFWKGLPFKIKYEENKNTLIEITPRMTPNDGILQGIILERYEQGTLVAYIFLDEDWKRAFGNSITIVYGKEYEKTKSFAWKQVTKGIYFDTVQEDMTRFKANYEYSFGGILVGNIIPQDAIVARDSVTAIRAT